MYLNDCIVVSENSLFLQFVLYTVTKVIDFPQYNMKCSGENVILRGIFHVVSCFLLHFMLLYIAEIWITFRTVYNSCDILAQCPSVIFLRGYNKTQYSMKNTYILEMGIQETWREFFFLYREGDWQRWHLARKTPSLKCLRLSGVAEEVHFTIRIRIHFPFDVSRF